MLGFLRKYQKIIFGAVTTVLIVSLAFFGSYGGYESNTKVEEKDFPLGSAVDGSVMSHLEIDKISRFIGTDCYDLDLENTYERANFFNDGFIKKDIVATGVARMLAIEFFDSLQEDFQEKLEKQKTFKSYRHPDAPFLTQEAVWGQFLPDLSKGYHKIRSKDFELSKESVGSLIDVYLQNARFPSSYVKKVINYQENQYEWIRKDPYLSKVDFSMFHFHKFEDWFGKTFLNLISQIVHNASIYATNQGYKVSKQEAKADLLKNGFENLKAKNNNETISGELVDKYWKELLSILRMSEDEALRVWSKIMICRKLVNDYGNSIFVDNLLHDEFNQYASEKIEVTLYKLPEDLRFNDFDQWMQFQVYQDLTKTANKDSLMKKAPELFSRTYEIEYAHISKQELQTKVPLKTMWNWQEQDQNWSKLAEKFSELSNHKKASRESRLEILERLATEKHEEIDAFSRAQILEEQGDVFLQTLAGTPMEKKTLAVTLGKNSLDFPGIENPDELIKLLDKAQTKLKRDQSDQEAFKACQKLEFYTQDGENYFSFYLLKKSQDPKLMSFKEAREKQVLSSLLDKRLKEFYSKAKELKPSEFKTKEDKDKEYITAKNSIGKLYFEKSLKKIEDDYKQILGKKQEPFSFSDYAKYGFLKVFNQAEQKLRNNEEEDTLFGDYKLEKEEIDLSRKNLTDFVSENTFKMKEGDISNVLPSKEMNLVFFKVNKSLDREDHDNLDKVLAAQEILSEDAKRHLMKEFIDTLKASDSIHLDKFKALQSKDS